MARIFSIAFDFKNERHTALVTAGSQEGQFTIAPVDEELKNLLPAGKLSFSNLADLQHLADRQPQLHELAFSMVVAVHQKLQATTG